MAAGFVHLFSRLLLQRKPLRLRPRADVLPWAPHLPASQARPRLRRLHVQGEGLKEPAVQVVRRQRLPQRVRLLTLRPLPRVRLARRLPQNIHLRHIRACRPREVVFWRTFVRLLVAGLEVHCLWWRG